MKLSTFLTSCVGTLGFAFVASQFASELTKVEGLKLAFVTQSFNTAPADDEVAVELVQEDGSVSQIAVARHEVTFGEWQSCVDAGACKHKPKRRNYVENEHPVSGVSWHDVQQYIAWKSLSSGLTYRLPLESEWRLLAKGVLDEKVDKLFEDPRMAWAADYANFGKRAERRTHPVGHFGTEKNGVTDLTGNVWEWTASCWRSNNASNDEEQSSNCGGVRVLAGAHMTYQSELIRVVPTGGCSIGFPPANIGFRLVRDIEPNTQIVQHTTQNNNG